MKFLIVGDVHGYFDQFFIALNRSKRLVKYDAIIQLGDFGIYPDISAVAMNKFRRQYCVNSDIYFIDGNHENHNFLFDNCEKLKECGFYYCNRGSVREFDGSRLGFFGGALNVDRPQETFNVPDDDEINKGIDNFINIDVLFTHSCPGNCGIGMMGDPYFLSSIKKYIDKSGYKSSELLDSGDLWLKRLWDNIKKPRVHAFGHFHTNRYKKLNGVDHYCYDTISGRSKFLVTVYDTKTKSINTYDYIDIRRKK